MTKYDNDHAGWHRLYDRFAAGIPVKHQWTFFWYLMDNHRDEDLDMSGILARYREFKGKES